MLRVDTPLACNDGASGDWSPVMSRWPLVLSLKTPGERSLRKLGSVGHG